MSRFIIISGPSCVGKSPLHKALQKFYPELLTRLTPLVLYNSRIPRPGEQDGVDYHFRSRQAIEELAKRPGIVTADVRGDLQALDRDEIETIFARGDQPFFEGNPFIPARLWDAGVLNQFPSLTIFISPLSHEELRFLQEPAQRIDLAAFVTDVMRRKLLRRTHTQKTYLALNDLEEIERRASSALSELGEAWKYQYVIPNHDGEDSEHWDAFYYPIGDARKTLLTVAALLQGEDAQDAEHWDNEFLKSDG